MPSFVIDSGGLAPAVIGRRVAVDEVVCRAVRGQVLDVLGEEMFAVGWDEAHVPMLTAMDRTGRAVGVAVLPHLDPPRLADLLTRAGRLAAASWLATAGRYPGGVGAFRRDWNAFRESVPADVASEAALTILTGEVHAEVADAIPILAGVRIIEVQARTTEGGQILLTVDGIARQRARRRNQVTKRVPLVVDRAGVERDEPDTRTRPREPVPGPEGVGVPTGQGRSRQGADAGQSNGTHRGKTPQEATEPDRSSSSEVIDLRAVADLVGAPMTIELRAPGLPAHRATLATDGTLVLTDGRTKTDLHALTRHLGNGRLGDPWQLWCFVAGGLPLAEARVEAQLLRRREIRPRSTRPGAHRGNESAP